MTSDRSDLRSEPRPRFWVCGSCEAKPVMSGERDSAEFPALGNSAACLGKNRRSTGLRPCAKSKARVYKAKLCATFACLCRHGPPGSHGKDYGDFIHASTLKGYLP